MMKKVLVVLLILVLPAYSVAAYKVILKNGAAIDGVRTYNESGDDVNLYFDTGSMSILKKDVLRIDGAETPEKEDDLQEEQPGQEAEPQQDTQPSPDRKVGSESRSSAQEDDSKQVKFNQLNNDLNAIDSELKTVQEREHSLVREINEKADKKVYNTIQLKQLEKEVDPLKQELAEVQQKKEQLIQRKYAVENEIREIK
jgi:hypothetical protein